MSTDTNDNSDDPMDRQQEKLDRLYECRDELKTIAESDARYAKYAQNFLDSLREAGYDV